ncbi:Hyalin [Holothuria leucospilota]|uniref:Hyalin n=1 Tax=Holothuria leucospilota TaxID=206669 RepID=A0A9Q0YJ63_HOLLE|nr:Hyalin [Holothuria leucospilota]
MSKMEKIFGVLIWIFILAILSHVAQAQVCEADPCPAGERCFVRTALGATPYVCECTPPGGIGFDCSNTDIPYDELFTCYGRECTSSTFTTPNFPSPYPTNYRALFLIFVPGGEEITFQLGFPYDIGPGDFLYLGRGLDFTEADLLRPSISGEFYAFGTDDGTFRPFTLLGDAFWMYFVSDGDNSAGAVGFGILWTARMITNQGPEILNCPQDISLTLQTMSDQIPVTWVEPSSSDPTATVTSNRSPGQAFGIPSENTVTYTFTNGQGVSTCSFVITISSATGDRPPVITNCPGSITDFADDAFSGALVNWRAPDVTDDSPGMLEVTQSHIPPEFFAIGEHMVTYTFTDSAGNSETCSFMVTVIDITPPSFNNCPSDISNTATSPNGAIVEWQRPTASDNSAQVAVTGNFEPGDQFDIGDTMVLYTAVDNSGNSASCEFTVTVTFTGNTGVTINNCPADMTVVAENGQTFMFVTWTPPTGQDANGQNIVPMATFQPGSFFRVGSQTVVRYTFLGSGGQTDVCSFTIRVIAGVDMGLRVEGCSNDILELAPMGFNFITVSWTEPTAVDQFGNRYTAEGSQSPGNYFEVGTTTRVTYNFMDNAGNTAQCSFLVTVQFVGDQLDVVGCPNIPIRETVPVGSSTVPVFWTPPSVSQNAVVGAVEVLSNFQPGDLFPPGETTVTYSFTDSVGSTGLCSFTVIVSQLQDVTPPTVVCPGDISRSIPAGQLCLSITWEIPSTSDDSGGAVVTSSSPSSGSCLMAGRTTVTVTATDPSGNQATCQFFVMLQATDNEPPTVICPSDIVRSIPLTDGCTQITWEIPFVNDNSGGVVNAVSAPVSGTCFMVNSVTNVVVTAMDPSGNTNTCQFTVTVNELDIVDNNPPFVLCPNDITRNIPIEQGCTDVSWEIPFVEDDSGEVTTTAVPPSGTCFSPGMTDVMVTAVDPSGNTDVCGFIVNVIALDFEPPTLTCPNDIVREIPVTDECVVVNWEVPFVSDNSGGNIEVLSTPVSGSCFFVGTTSNVLVTAEDPQGNLARCTFTITVTELVTIDTTPPTVLCPSDITQDIPVEQPCIQVTWEVPFFADDSGGPVSIASSPNSGSCISDMTSIVSVTATDPSGNENTCNFIITLRPVDNEPPTVLCPSDISRNIPILQPCMEVSWEIPFFTDNSGDSVALSSTPPSGSCLLAGRTVVLVTATDPSGNENSCTFVVDLIEIDTEPPSLQCPEDISQTLFPGDQCAEVTWQIPFFSDNSGQDVTITSVPPSGTCFSDSVNVITVTALDPSNNMNSCTFVVRINEIDPCTPNPCLNRGTCVSAPSNNLPFTCLCEAGFTEDDCGVDTQPPSVSCPPDISVTLGAGETCAVAVWDAPQTSDNSGNDVVVVTNPESGTCFEPGTTTIQVAAIDQSGNMDQCTFVVDVLEGDTTPPTVVCPQNMAQETNNGCVVVGWDIPFAFDTGGEQVGTMSDPPSGTCFEIGVTEVVVMATDTSGNSATCSFTVAITADVDNIPPVVICPQSIRETLTEGSCIIVEWEIPFSVDDQGGPVTEISDPPSGTCFEVGRTDITVTAVDDAGNSGTCSFFIEIVPVDDTTPPVVQNCPTGDVEVTVPLGETCTPIIWMEPSAVDDDGQPPAVLRFPSQPDCFSPGVILFTYIFTDQAGNIAFCTFNVVIMAGQVVDNTPPTVLSCPSNANGMITTIGGCTEVTWTPPIATDDSIGVLQGVPNFEPGTCFEEGLTTVMYTFTDPSGNMAVCTFEVVVTLIDDVPPEVSGCPGDISLEALNEDCTQVTWIEPQAVDNIGLIVSVETDFTPGQCFPLGMTTVIYTFRDPSGNSAVCRFVVNIMEPQVVDNDPPVVIGCLEVPVIAQTTSGSTCTEAFWVEPMAVDEVSGLPTTEVNFSPGECFPIGTTNVVYTFTDEAGNQAFCRFNVIVQVGGTINTAPLFAVCPSPPPVTSLAGDIGNIVSWTNGVCTDTEDGSITPECVPTSGSFFLVGSSTVTCTCTDSGGLSAECSFDAVVVGGGTTNTPPLFAVCPSPPPVTSLAGNIGNVVSWTDGVCTDTEDGVITPECDPMSGSFLLVGSSTVTCTCTDSGGLSAECSFDAVVVGGDTDPPDVFNCPNDITDQAGPDNSCTRIFWNEPFALDEVSGLAMATQNFAPGDCFSLGVSIVMYTFTDASGNSADCQFTVNINLRDFLPPTVINCPDDITQQGQPGISCTPVMWTVPTAIDNLPGEIDIFASSSPGDCFPAGLSTVVYQFADVAGNTESCVFSVFIMVDNVPPVVSNCPTDINEQAAPGATCAVIFWSEPNANDAESGIPSLDRNFSPGTCFNVGNTEVVYTFTDTAGNEAVCRFQIRISQVIDFTPPVVRNCPMDVTIPGLPGTTCQTVFWIPPTATDDVPGDITVTNSADPGDCFPFVQTVVTYTFTDAAGNRASCAFLVQVFLADTTPPQVSNCPTDIFLQAPAGASCQSVVWIEPTAVDDSGGAVFTDNTHSPGDCLPFGTNVVTYTFSDLEGNSAICRFIVNITPLDNNPPVISNCPNDITLESLLSSGCQNVIWSEPTATDETSVPFLEERSHVPGECFPAGPTLVTYQFADLEGNIAMCTFVITVVLRDTDPPTVFGCPTDMTVQAVPGEQCAVAQWNEPFAMDSGRGDIVTMQTSRPGRCLPIGDTLVSYIFTDGSGNVAACTFTVTVFVLDVIPPTVTNCPDDITLVAVSNDQCANVNWVEPVGTDEGPGPVTIRDQTHFPGNCFRIGQTFVTYVFQDAAGNTAACTFSITINPRDVMPPEIIFCPADISLEIVSSGQCLFVNWQDPLFTDDSPLEEVSITQNFFSGTCYEVGTRTVVYTLTDAAGNSATCSFNVEIIRRDFAPPVVSNCPTDITLRKTPNLQCLSVTWIEPTATDNSLPITTDVTHPTGTCFEEGETVVTYSFRDAVGNRNSCTFSVVIQILDIVSPIITACPSSIMLTLPAGQSCVTAAWIPPTATDESGPVTSMVNVNQNTCFTVGQNEVIYTFRDQAGNSASCSFQVIVAPGDTQPPRITCPPDISVILAAGETCAVAMWETPQASDNSGANVIVISTPESGNCFGPGTTTVQVTAMDQTGNTNDCTFNVNEMDIIPPVLSPCPPDQTGIALAGSCQVINWTPPTATDNSGQVEVSSDIMSGFCFSIGETVVTYTATDSSNNIMQCTFLVTIKDNEPPAVMGCPLNFFVSVSLTEGGQIIMWDDPTAVDNSGRPVVVEMTGRTSGTFFEIGTNENIVYTFTDEAGNSAICAFIINVANVTPPSFVTNCPPSPVVQFIGPMDENTVVTWTVPTAIDDIPGGLVTAMVTPDSDIFTEGNTQVTYTFSDAAGNSISCDFIVTVIGDTTLPVISGCPLQAVIGYTAVGAPSTVNWVPPTATDTDGGAITTASTHDPNQSVFQPGTTTLVTYTFTDVFGNAAQCSFQVILLEDSTPPTVENCPLDIVINLESGMTQGMAQWIAPTGTDDSGLPVTVERNGPPSGSQFPIGDSVITYTLTDSVGLTAVCTFTVTVRDVTPPQVLNCPPEDIVRYTMTAPVFVELPVLQVTDDTGAMPTLISDNIPDQSMFSVGSFPVSFVYSDGNGNIATCTYTVTVVVDNTAPMVVCPDPVQVFVPAGVTTTQVNYPSPAVSDDSGLTPSLVTSIGIASGGLFPVGVPSFVSFLYEDAAGNSGSCTLQVQVTEDSIPPTIEPQCTPTVMAFASSTNPQAVVNFVEPAATDNTGLEVTMTVTGLRSGSLFPAGVSTTIYTFTDSVGNLDSCQTVVTVEIDVTPPSIMDCPTNTVATVPNTEMQLLVNFATPTATDNSGEPTRLSGITGVSADNMYPVGTTTISYTFEDNYGNSAVCQFTITISQEVCNPSPCAASEACTSDGGNPPVAVCTPTSLPDTTAPVVSGCPTTAITQTVPTNSVPVFVNTPVPTATDDSNQSPTVATNGLPANNLFPEGSTDITYTFTDGSGNQVSCTFSVIIDVDYCSPNPCPSSQVCTEGSPVPSQVICAGPCNSNPCNPVLEFCLELPTGGFFCSPNGITPTIPVINNCPAADITQTVDSTVIPPVFVDTPVPTTTTAGATLDVTGLPAGNLFPEGSTLITYTFTSPDTGQAVCTFSVIVDVDYCNPNPCGTGVTCTEGSPNPAQVVCATQCMITTCPAADEFCFLQANVPTCVNIGSNPELSNCPASAYLVYTMTGTAIFDVPVPSLTNFPTVAATITMNPMGNSFVAGTNTVVTFTLRDDAGATIVVCNAGVSALTDLEPPVVTACPDPRNTVSVSSGTTEVLVIPSPQPQATDNSNQVSVAVTGQPANDIYPLGERTVTYTFTDAAGNTATCSFIIAVVVDICSPTPCLANQICVVDTNPQGFLCADQCMDTTTCPGQLCFSSIGLTAGSPCVNSLTDPALGNCPPEMILALAPFGTNSATVVLPSPFLLNFPSYPVTINQIPPGDSFGIGENNVFQFITDDVGAPISICRRSIRVEAAPDASFLLVNCDMLTPIIRYVASGTETVQVFFNEPSTVGGQGTVMLSVGDSRSGSVYPVGTTSAVFTFTDETPSTLQCTRLISVMEDATAPTVSDCTTPVTVTVDSATTSSVVTISPEPTAVDNSNLPVTVTQSGFPANDVYPVGSTVVSYTFTDSVGNTATCDITVTVDQDLCNPNPCLAGQTCAEDASMQGFSCTVSATPCNPSPCLPGETCVEPVTGGFVCFNAGRRRRSMDWTDEDSRQKRFASSDGEVSSDTGNSSNVMLSYMFIISVAIAVTLSTAIITAWCHWKRTGRGQRSRETASSNI